MSHGYCLTNLCCLPALVRRAVFFVALCAWHWYGTCTRTHGLRATVSEQRDLETLQPCWIAFQFVDLLVGNRAFSLQRLFDLTLSTHLTFTTQLLLLSFLIKAAHIFMHWRQHSSPFPNSILQQEGASTPYPLPASILADAFRANLFWQFSC